MGIATKDRGDGLKNLDFLQVNKFGNKGGFGKVGVLMGGASTERGVSLKSGKAVYESLKQLNLNVIAVDITTDNIDENKELIEAQKIDCAFLALHGRFGEDGQIQEILESLKIAYTGSGALASRIAMDKVASREIFQSHGLRVPKCEVLEKAVYKRGNTFDVKEFKAPFVVKPVAHGSSVGLSIVDKESDLDNAVNLAFSFDERVLIEEYISGREVTVGILDDHVLPVVEIIPKKRFFDYEAKYQAGMTEYIVPAKLEDKIVHDLGEMALKAHKALGCYGCSRVDIILHNADMPVILEVNTIPGFTQTSLLPKAAKAAGIGFAQLCGKLIQLAYEKAHA